MTHQHDWQHLTRFALTLAEAAGQAILPHFRKNSPIDVKAREKYADYGKARDQMMKATHTRHAPWTIVDFNSQKRGRLNLIRDLLDRLPDQEVPEQSLVLPPLKTRVGKERYAGPVKPIAGKY